MGQRGKPAMSHRELRVAYLEACAEIRKLRERIDRLAQDNIAMSGRLAEIDLGQDRMDVFVLARDQPTEQFPVPAAPRVDLVKRPALRIVQMIAPPLSAAEAAENMKTFLDRVQGAATETAKDQEKRIL